MRARMSGFDRFFTFLWESRVFWGSSRTCSILIGLGFVKFWKAAELLIRTEAIAINAKIAGFRKFSRFVLASLRVAPVQLDEKWVNYARGILLPCLVSSANFCNMSINQRRFFYSAAYLQERTIYADSLTISNNAGNSNSDQKLK